MNKNPNPPSDKRYKHFIGKWIRYKYKNIYRYKKIDGIKLTDDTLHNSKTGSKGNYHYFILEGINPYLLKRDFGCKQTKRRINRGEYLLIEPKDLETIKKLDKIN
jgi:hypothetical protein